MARTHNLVVLNAKRKHLWSAEAILEKIILKCLGVILEAYLGARTILLLVGMDLLFFSEAEKVNGYAVVVLLMHRVVFVYSNNYSRRDVHQQQWLSLYYVD